MIHLQCFSLQGHILGPFLEIKPLNNQKQTEIISSCWVLRIVRGLSDNVDHYSDLVICSSCVASVAG